MRRKIAYHKYAKTNKPTDYEKNKKYYNDLEAKDIEQEEGNKMFIQKLRDEYKNQLQQHAIINIEYYHIFSYRGIYNYNKEISNQKTGKSEPLASAVKKIFITNPKLGKAYYSYDKDFYKGMADGEIRTIAVIWTDNTRAPDHPDYGKSNTIAKNEVNRDRYSDNPDFYLYHFNKKMDWKKLEAILGK